ncbi:MAG: hypothetical protein ABI557_04980 [Aureliella sp.]
MRSRRLLAMAATVAVVTCGLFLPVARAQQPQRPVAIVSISPLDRLLPDTTYLLKACNVPEIGGMIGIMANQYTQGIDHTKPLGVSVTLDGQMPNAVVYLPLKSRDEFFEVLAGMGIEPDDLGNGIFEIAVNPVNRQTVFAKDSDGWLFIAQTEEALATLPEDPTKLLGNLPQQYNVAINLDVQALPQEIKQMAIGEMRKGLERQMAEQQRDMSAADQAKAKELSEANIKQLEQMINDTDKVIVGWNTDSSKQQVNIDVAAQFISGSKLANQMAELKNLSSNFAKLVAPGAAAQVRFTSKISDEDKASQIMNLRNSISQIEQQLPEADREVAKDILQGLSKVMEQTIQEGVFDGAGSVSLDDDTLRAVVGGAVANGRALEVELKKIADSVKDKKDAPQFKFSYGEYKGMSLHSVQFLIKSSDRSVQKVFGDSLMVHVATADKAYVLSIDPTGDAALKQAIDRIGSSQGEKVTPFDGAIEVAQILQFAQSIAPNPMIENALKTAQGFSGKDKVQVAARVIERGALYRMTVDEGVLRAGGAAAKGAGGGGGF